MKPSKHRQIIKLIWLLSGLVLGLLVSACGIRVEVAPTGVANNSTPASSMPLPATDPGLTRIVAAPRVAFTDDGQAQAQLFMSPNLSDAYLIVNHTLQLAVQYDAAWFGNVPGSARLHLSAATRADASHPWLQGDSAEQPLTSETIPARITETLIVYITPPRPGNFEVRTEVEIVVYPDKGTALNRIESSRLLVATFSDPGTVPLNVPLMHPAIGGLSASSLLFDWRDWVNPCTVSTSGVPANAISALQIACKAVNVQNIPALFDALQSIRGLLTQPSQLAQLTDAFGLIASVAGDWPVAANQFGTAAEMWQNLDNAALMAISRQNQIAALAMAGDTRPQVYGQLLELHDQYSDDAGRYIVQANLARLSGQRNQLDEANSFFVSNNLPQAAITQEWLHQLDATATAAPAS